MQTLQEKANFVRSNYYMAKSNIFKAIGKTKENTQLYEKIHTRLLRSQIDNSVKKQVKKSIESKLKELAKGLPSTGYSMGSTYTVRLGNSKYYGTYSNCVEYSNSCRYKAVHGSITFSLTFNEYRNAKNIANILTVILGNTRYKGIKKAKWLKLQGSKNTAKYVWHYGYIVGDYHGITIEQCQTALERQKKIAKAKELELKELKKYQAKLYCYSDSINAGNCVIGTNNFINKFNLDKAKKYKGGFLLKLANNVNMEHYIIRMFKAKQGA
jgi:hypothetical protein